MIESNYAMLSLCIGNDYHHTVYLLWTSITKDWRNSIAYLTRLPVSGILEYVAAERFHYSALNRGQRMAWKANLNRRENDWYAMLPAKSKPMDGIGTRSITCERTLRVPVTQWLLSEWRRWMPPWERKTEDGSWWCLRMKSRGERDGESVWPINGGGRSRSRGSRNGSPQPFFLSRLRKRWSWE